MNVWVFMIVIFRLYMAVVHETKNVVLGVLLMEYEKRVNSMSPFCDIKSSCQTDSTLCDNTKLTRSHNIILVVLYVSRVLNSTMTM